MAKKELISKSKVCLINRFLLLALVMIILTSVFLVGCTGNNPDQGESDSTDDNTESNIPEEEPETLYDIVVKSNDEIDEGYQILVNNSIPFARTDEVELVNVRENAKYMKTSRDNILLDERALIALDEMTKDFIEATGCQTLQIHHGHRTVQFQKEIYSDNVRSRGTEYARRYIAIPEHSEHHTGLAIDISFTVSTSADQGYKKWLWDNCSDYGYLLRYPANKEAVTMIAYEDWHFRYMGIPHAKATEYFGMCYEEYMNMLEEYTIDKRVVYVTLDGKVKVPRVENMPTKDGYIIYYTPMTPGETTEIRIPHGEEFDNYEISGNNVDGFITTIYLDSSAE